MGKVLMSGAGGGVKSDDVTASKWDVVQGKKTITTDSDDEVVEGTLPEHGGDVGSMSSSLYIPGNLYYSDFPKGAYRRSDIGEAGGRVTIPLERLRHDIGYTNVNKVLSDTSIAGQQGAIPFQNAETDGDRAWATAIACWEGQANFGVRNGHYLNGVNHIRGNIPNFFAANIKKGVNMGGLVGTFEGWVPTPQDLYYNGVLSGPLNVSRFIQENTRLYLNSDVGAWMNTIQFTSPIDVRSYSRFIFEGHFLRSSSDINPSIGIRQKKLGGYVSNVFFANGANRIDLDITQAITLSDDAVYIEFSEVSRGTYITRIRLE